MSTPFELANREVLALSTKRDISNVSCCNSPRGKVSRKRTNQCKRSKTTFKARKCVSFAKPEDDVIGFSPFAASKEETAACQSDHHRIWYSSKEYASFLQDRIDTIRVYRSVRGNMAGLEDYYCTTGLEHFLPENGQIVLKQKQMSVISAVLSEQRRQKLLQQPDPEYVSRLVGRLAKDAMEQAQKRASTNAPILLKSIYDMSENGNDMRSCLGRIGKEILSNPIRLVSLPLPPRKLSSNTMFPVDVTTLRQMNLKLLESFHTKTESTSTSSVSSKDSTASKMTLEGMSHHPSVHKPSQSGSVNSTVLDAMNEALAITDVFSDPECK